MKMNKKILASVIALGMLSGSAMAADIQFTGSVQQNTCDIQPSTSVGLGSNSIDLGVVAPGGHNVTPVQFALKPAATDGVSAAGCAEVAKQQDVMVTWTGGRFDGTALGASAGTATDAHVYFAPLNATDGTNAVAKNGTVNTFKASDLTGDGLKYQAVLVGGQETGDFQSAVVATLSYK
ncbi:hypothetical protein [Escherichia coli]|uniref:hypothetical protein n=1 Tax=Escherichia coli TaxID=562 RepID=UPI0038B3D649